MVARVPNPRTARAATARRMVHKSKVRYASIWRVSLAIGSLLAFLMVYVVLTSSMTGLAYAVVNAKHQREALQEETMRLDDRIATLESEERLSAIASKLGMRDPQRFALVRMPQPRANDSQQSPLLSSIAGLFR